MSSARSSEPSTRPGTMHLKARGSRKIPFVPYLEQRDSIMREFDFAKVGRVMRALGWQWATLGPRMRVPTTRDLRVAAESLLWECWIEAEDPWHCACGGFSVDKSEGFLRLYFALEELDLWGMEVADLEEMSEGD